MSTDGDHQLSTLRCGHMFGYACILQWLESGDACPICRMKAKPGDIISLHWDAKVPIDQTLYNTLSAELEQSLSEKQELAQELEQAKSELLRARDEMSEMFVSADSSQHQGHRRGHMTMKYRSPAIIFERTMSRARKLCLLDNALVCCCSWNAGETMRNGLQIFNLSNMRSELLQVHEVPIWDIARNPEGNHTVMTVSTDKRMSVIDINTKQEVDHASAREPLFCCDWASSNTAVAGGKGASLHVWDRRTGNSVAQHVLDGHTDHPFRSVAHITGDKVLAITQKEGRCFDLRNQKFDPNYRGTLGGFSARTCRGTDVTVIASEGKLSFYKYSHRKEMLLPTTTIDSHGTARPMIALFDSDIYTAYGKSSNDFGLTAARRIDIDIWERYKSQFLHTEHPSPLMDLAISKDGNDIYVFSLSADLLRIVSVPTCL